METEQERSEENLACPGTSGGVPAFVASSAASDEVVVAAVDAAAAYGPGFPEPETGPWLRDSCFDPGPRSASSDQRSVAFVDQHLETSQLESLLGSLSRHIVDSHPYLPQRTYPFRAPYVPYLPYRGFYLPSQHQP